MDFTHVLQRPSVIDCVALQPPTVSPLTVNPIVPTVIVTPATVRSAVNCPNCGAGFTAKRSLNRHLGEGQRQSKCPGLISAGPLRPSSRGNIKHVCSDCHQSFANKASLTKHVGSGEKTRCAVRKHPNTYENAATPAISYNKNNEQNIKLSSLQRQTRRYNDAQKCLSFVQTKTILSSVNAGGKYKPYTELSEKSKERRRKLAMSSLKLLFGPDCVLEGMADLFGKCKLQNKAVRALKTSKSCANILNKITKTPKTSNFTEANQQRSIKMFIGARQITGQQKWNAIVAAQKDSLEIMPGVPLMPYKSVRALLIQDTQMDYHINPLPGLSRADGCCRRLDETIMGLVMRLKKYGEPQWVKDQENTFHISIAADGLPIGKDAATTFSVSLLEFGHDFHSPNNNAFLMGCSYKEEDPIVLGYAKFLCGEYETLLSTPKTIVYEDKDGILKTEEVKFKIGPWRGDQAMIAKLNGESTNGATYPSSYCNVTLKEKTVTGGSIGDGPLHKWHPWTFQSRIEGAKTVQEFKDGFSKTHNGKEVPKSKINEFIARNHRLNDALEKLCGAASASLVYRFSGQEVRAFSCNFASLLNDIILKMNKKVHVRMMAMLAVFQTLTLYLSQITRIMSDMETSPELLNELKDYCSKFHTLKATVRCPKMVHFNDWTIGRVVPFMATKFYHEYGLGLGLASMQGAEHKHVLVKRALRNTQPQNRWYQALIYDRLTTADLPIMRNVRLPDNRGGKNASYINRAEEGCSRCGIVDCQYCSMPNLIQFIEAVEIIAITGVIANPGLRTLLGGTAEVS